MKKVIALIALLVLLVLVSVAVYAATPTTDPNPYTTTINQIFDAFDLILSRFTKLIPALAVIGTTVAVWYGRAIRKDQRVIVEHQKEAKIERADISAKVDGLTSQAIQTAGDAGFAQGAASTTSPEAAREKITLAENKALGVVATAAKDAEDVVSKAAATAKESLDSNHDK